MKLNSTEIERLQGSLPLWRYDAERGGILTREFVFRDFAEAIGLQRNGLNLRLFPRSEDAQAWVCA